MQWSLCLVSCELAETQSLKDVSGVCRVPNGFSDEDLTVQPATRTAHNPTAALPEELTNLILRCQARSDGCSRQCHLPDSEPRQPRIQLKNLWLAVLPMRVWRWARPRAQGCGASSTSNNKERQPSLNTSSMHSVVSGVAVVCSCAHVCHINYVHDTTATNMFVGGVQAGAFRNRITNMTGCHPAQQVHWMSTSQVLGQTYVVASMLKRLLCQYCEPRPLRPALAWTRLWQLAGSLLEP